MYKTMDSYGFGDKFHLLLAIKNCTAEVLTKTRDNKWVKMFSAKTVFLGQKSPLSKIFIRLVNDPECFNVKRHFLMLELPVSWCFLLPTLCLVDPAGFRGRRSLSQQRQVTREIRCKREGVKMIFEYWKNSQLQHVLLLTGAPEKVYQWISFDPAAKDRQTKRVQKHIPAASSKTPVHIAQVVFPQSKRPKSLCTCVVAGQRHVHSLFMDLNRDKRLYLTNQHLLLQFTQLRELSVKIHQFQKQDLADFLSLVGRLKTVVELRLEGQFEDINVLFLLFPRQVRVLELRCYGSPRRLIPPTIENASNLQKLVFDKLPEKMRPEIFIMPNLEAVYSEPQRCAILPSTAYPKFSQYFRGFHPDLKPDKVKPRVQVSSLFELATAVIFTTRTTIPALPPVIWKEMLVLRNSFKMCSVCHRIMSKDSHRQITYYCNESILFKKTLCEPCVRKNR